MKKRGSAHASSQCPGTKPSNDGATLLITWPMPQIDRHLPGATRLEDPRIDVVRNGRLLTVRASSDGHFVLARVIDGTDRTPEPCFGGSFGGVGVGPDGGRNTLGHFAAGSDPNVAEWSAESMRRRGLVTPGSTPS
jgi:hypothetical protein